MPPNKSLVEVQRSPCLCYSCPVWYMCCYCEFKNNPLGAPRLLVLQSSSWKDSAKLYLAGSSKIAKGRIQRHASNPPWRSHVNRRRETIFFGTGHLIYDYQIPHSCIASSTRKLVRQNKNTKGNVKDWREKQLVAVPYPHKVCGTTLRGQGNALCGDKGGQAAPSSKQNFLGTLHYSYKL